MAIEDGGAIADGGGASIICSICLEAVADDGTKSWAKLICGHQFHLDCIGSAFNVKGAMQCPNCRRVEDGEWLYANGSHPLPDVEELADEEEEEEAPTITYSETSYGVHWCPFGGFTTLPSSFEEGEYPSSTYDFLGRHDVYAEVAPVSSTSPYIAYAPSYWNGASPANDVFGAYDAYTSAGVQYPSWDYSSSTFGAANHVGGPRTGRSSSDIPRPATHPHLFGSSITSSSTDTPPELARRQPRRDHTSLQANSQQSAGNPPLVLNSVQRSTHAAAPTVVSPPAEQHNGGGFYYFSSAPTFQEAEQPAQGGYFYYWGHGYQSPYTQRDSSALSLRGPSHPPNGAGPHGSHSWHGFPRNPS